MRDFPNTFAPGSQREATIFLFFASLFFLLLACLHGCAFRLVPYFNACRTLLRLCLLLYVPPGPLARLESLGGGEEVGISSLGVCYLNMHI